MCDVHVPHLLWRNNGNLYNIFPFLFVAECITSKLQSLILYSTIASANPFPSEVQVQMYIPYTHRESGSEWEKYTWTHVIINFGERTIPNEDFLVRQHVQDALDRFIGAAFYESSARITYMNVLHKPFHMIKLITAKWIDNEKCANPGSHFDVCLCNVRSVHCAVWIIHNVHCTRWIQLEFK